MKVEWNKRYTTIAAYAVLVIFCVIFCIFFFLRYDSFGSSVINFILIFNPVFYGILITYLLCPMVGFFEKRVFAFLDKKRRYRLKRTLSVVCTLLVALVAVVLFVWRIVPQVFRGYADLQNMSGLYLETVKAWLMSFSGKEGMFSGYIDRIIEYATDFIEKIYTGLASIIPDVAGIAGKAVGVLTEFFLGIILAVYFLFSKERLIAQSKKTAHAFLKDDQYSLLSRGMKLADKNFGGFIKGQLGDAFIIGTLCFICTMIIGIPYYPLVSTLMGISYIIPVIGPLLGTVVGAIIIFLAAPIEVLWFVLFMIILGQINRHLIRPRIIRSGVDASAAFMLAAIVIMTGFFGFWGLIIGVPVFAILYVLLRSAIYKKLARKGLATDTLSYIATEAGRELYRETEQKKELRNIKAAEQSAAHNTHGDLLTKEETFDAEQEIQAQQMENKNVLEKERLFSEDSKMESESQTPDEIQK